MHFGKTQVRLNQTQYKQKGFTPVYFLVGVLILAALGGAYYFGKSQTPKLQLQNPVVVSQTPQASPNETANWKTYTNTRFGYSIQYPLNWYVHVAPDNALFSLSNYDDTNPRLHPNPNIPNPGDIKIEIYSNTPSFISAPTVNIERITFAGQKASLFKHIRPGVSQPNGATMINIIYIDKGSYRYGIASYVTAISSMQEKIVSQILSTFRFDSLP